MSGNGTQANFDQAFDLLEEKIAAATERRETCRRGMLVSRVAIVGGAAVLALAFFMPVWRTAPTVLGALSAVIGGLVWLGANRSSDEEARLELEALEANKASLFDEVAARNGWRDFTPTVH